MSYIHTPVVMRGMDGHLSVSFTHLPKGRLSQEGISLVLRMERF